MQQINFYYLKHSKIFDRSLGERRAPQYRSEEPELVFPEMHITNLCGEFSLSGNKEKTEIKLHFSVSKCARSEKIY